VIRWLGIVNMCLCCVLPVHAQQVLCDPFISSTDYLEYGNRYLLEGDYSLSIYSYTCAIQGDEDNIAARKGLVLLYLKRGDREAAFEHLQFIYE
jgi:Tfp pilus assembly protein PilF